MEKVIVVRKGEKMKTVSLEGMQFDLLLRTDKLEALFCTFDPGASLGSYKHVGEEVHIILRGEMELEIDGEKHLLKEGDVLWYLQYCLTRQETLEKKKRFTSLL